MDKDEKLLNMLMDFNEDIRFAAVVDPQGTIQVYSQRDGLKNLVPFDETKQIIMRGLKAWPENDRVKSQLGKGQYTIASYSKIKRITVPLDGGRMLYITISNEPLKKGIFGNKKSYGHIADMGKILSIVDFIKDNK